MSHTYMTSLNILWKSKMFWNQLKLEDLPSTWLDNVFFFFHSSAWTENLIYVVNNKLVNANYSQCTECSFILKAFVSLCSLNIAVLCCGYVLFCLTVLIILFINRCLILLFAFLYILFSHHSLILRLTLILEFVKELWSFAIDHMEKNISRK